MPPSLAIFRAQKPFEDGLSQERNGAGLPGVRPGRIREKRQEVLQRRMQEPLAQPEDARVQQIAPEDVECPRPELRHPVAPAAGRCPVHRPGGPCPAGVPPRLRYLALPGPRTRRVPLFRHQIHPNGQSRTDDRTDAGPAFRRGRGRLRLAG